MYLRAELAPQDWRQAQHQTAAILELLQARPSAVTSPHILPSRAVRAAQFERSHTSAEQVAERN